jgi:hypothetical protein
MNKNTTRRILRGYFENSGANQYTAIMPTDVDLNYGLSDIVIVFSDASSKTISIALTFQFDAPADDFWQKNNIILFGDLTLDNIPVSIGTAINMDYIFDSEEDFLGMYSQVFSDNVIEIEYK